MTTETLEALQESIRHWHRLATGRQEYGEVPDPKDCALCGLFLYQSPRCRGCPVSESVKDTGCSRTPFSAARWAWIDATSCGDGPKALREAAFRTAAREELNFLLGLLPAEERPAMDAELAALDAARA